MLHCDNTSALQRTMPEMVRKVVDKDLKEKIVGASRSGDVIRFIAIFISLVLAHPKHD